MLAEVASEGPHMDVVIGAPMENPRQQWSSVMTCNSGPPRLLNERSNAAPDWLHDHGGLMMRMPLATYEAFNLKPEQVMMCVRPYAASSLY
jgi:hypothetical protein